MRIFGKSRAELFENAGIALTEMLTDRKKIRENESVVIRLESDCGESLLVEWMQEILYHFTVKKIAFSRFKVFKISGVSLEAELWGEKLDSTRHPVHREVKAATRHNLNIVQGNEGYQAEVVLDI